MANDSDIPLPTKSAMQFPIARRRQPFPRAPRSGHLRRVPFLSSSSSTVEDSRSSSSEVGDARSRRGSDSRRSKRGGGIGEEILPGASISSSPLRSDPFTGAGIRRRRVLGAAIRRRRRVRFGGGSGWDSVAAGAEIRRRKVLRFGRSGGWDSATMGAGRQRKDQEVLSVEAEAEEDELTGLELRKCVKQWLLGGFVAQRITATGRRKTASARVVLQEGTGKVFINFRDAKATGAKFNDDLSYVCEDNSFKQQSTFDVMGIPLLDGSFPIDGTYPCIQIDDCWNRPHISIFIVCIMKKFDVEDAGSYFDLENSSDEDYSYDSDRELKGGS